MAHTTANLRDAATYEQPVGKKRSGLLARILHAVQEHQRLRAEEEVARYIQGHGAALTDSVERELAQRYSRSAR
jgi:hypothetical protein